MRINGNDVLDSLSMQMLLFMCMIVQKPALFKHNQSPEQELLRCNVYTLTRIPFLLSFLLPVFAAALLRGSELHQLAQRRLFPRGRDSRQLLRQLLRLQLGRPEERHCGRSQSQQTGEASSGDACVCVVFETKRSSCL